MPARRVAVALLASLTALSVVAAGCAGPSGVLRPVLELPEAPAYGPLVYIAPVEDLRSFADSSLHRRVPGLFHGLSRDPETIARIVGRRRSRTGPNLLLPEGEPAASLVRNAVAGGYLAAGRRIAAEPSDAHPSVEVKLLGLWCWAREHPMAPPRLEFSARVAVGDDVLHVDHFILTGGISTLAYQRLIRRGMEKLSAAVREHLELRGRS